MSSFAERQKKWSIIAHIYTPSNNWSKDFAIYVPGRGWIRVSDWEEVPDAAFMTYATASRKYFDAQTSAPDDIDYRTLNIYR
jgi:hypothetical protein